MSIDSQILSALRASPEGASGAELSQRLGVSRAAIWARIEEMRGLGYEIEASPHQGYRLVRVPDVLHADDLMSRLGEVQVVGRDIQVFQETTSTNDVVERLARDGVREGVVVFAESQTRGRGRLGRRWVSPARKGLWFSVLLRPVLAPPDVTQLTIAAATALARAVQGTTGVRPRIKWPNDLQVEGRKVAGILTEMSAETDRVKHVIMGMGVDVNQTLTDFPPELHGVATSLRIASGEVVERAALAVRILRELDRDYARVVRGRFGEVASEWEQQCNTIGAQVAIVVGDRRIRGRAEALDENGALLVRTPHGHLERVLGGDVTLDK